MLIPQEEIELLQERGELHENVSPEQLEIAVDLIGRMLDTADKEITESPKFGVVGLCSALNLMRIQSEKEKMAELEELANEEGLPVEVLFPMMMEEFSQQVAHQTGHAAFDLGYAYAKLLMEDGGDVIE